MNKYLTLIFICFLSSLLVTTIVIIQPTDAQIDQTFRSINSGTLTSGDYYDLWNTTVNCSYNITFIDHLTVDSGSQYLDIFALNSSYGTVNQWYIWEVSYIDENDFLVTIDNLGGANYAQYEFEDYNGVVSLLVNSTSIEIVAEPNLHVIVPMSFQTIHAIQSKNDDGSFNGGQLNIYIQEYTQTTPIYSSPTPTPTVVPIGGVYNPFGFNNISGYINAIDGILTWGGLPYLIIVGIFAFIIIFAYVEIKCISSKNRRI